MKNLFVKFTVITPLITSRGNGQLNRDRRICVFFVGMIRTFQNSSHIS